jgi:hypothetical protein
MRQLLIAVMFALCGIRSAADSLLIPLVDPADPVRITNAKIEFEDDIRPVMFVELENEADSVITTASVWLDTARFFTKTEMARAGDRKVWDCALGTTAAGRGSPQAIAPHGRVVARIPLVQGCQHNRDHEHFFVYVSRVGERFIAPSWQRDPQEFVRLLAAAMPHD